MDENAKQKRVVAFVDGFNLYHALKDNNLKNCRWLDLWSLTEKFLDKSSEKLEATFYFSAYYHFENTDMHKHKIYVQALRTAGVTPVLGQFKKTTVKCKVCKQTFLKPEEKRTDVNIGVFLLREAF